MAEELSVVAVENRKEKVPEALAAIRRTAGLVPRFVRQYVICPQRVTEFGIEWLPMEEFGGYDRESEWRINRWYLRELPLLLTGEGKFIFVQGDGYAVNAKAWDDEFLEYDFIGAPLPLWATVLLNPRHPFRRVGSGGFCIKSRKWLDVGLNSPPYDGRGEDIFQLMHQEYWTQKGCTVAPFELALRWCHEHWLEDRPRWDPTNSFGLHGEEGGRRLYEMAYLKILWRAWKKSRACRWRT